MASSVRAGVALQLGDLFSCVVDVVSAIDDDDKEIATRTLCEGVLSESSACVHKPTPINSLYRCPACGNEDKAHMKKGHQVGSSWALLDSNAFSAASAIAPELQTTLRLHVHKAEEMLSTTMPGGKAYFLRAGKGEDVRYALFHSTISEQPELRFTAEWAVRNKPARYLVTTFGSAIALHQIAWPSAIREAPASPATPAATDLAMAKQIAQLAVEPYDPASYVNHRKAEIAALISQSSAVEGLAPAAGSTNASPGSGGDLSATLQASLDMLRAKAVASTEATVAPRKTRARKASPAAVQAPALSVVPDTPATARKRARKTSVA